MLFLLTWFIGYMNIILIVQKVLNKNATGEKVILLMIFV